MFRIPSIFRSSSACAHAPGNKSDVEANQHHDNEGEAKRFSPFTWSPHATRWSNRRLQFSCTYYVYPLGPRWNHFKAETKGTCCSRAGVWLRIQRRKKGCASLKEETFRELFMAVGLYAHVAERWRYQSERDRARVPSWMSPSGLARHMLLGVSYLFWRASANVGGWA